MLDAASAAPGRYHRRVPLPSLYPDPPLLRSHALPVPGGHVLQVQEFGAADGIPAAVLHGGPGSGCSPLLRRVFDPARYRIVCPDQRGAGGSLPRGGIEHNSTDDLLADLRRVRETLGIRRWLVSGGSWGATLAVAHAAAEPEAIVALLLRASFLARPQDIAGFFGELSLDALAEALSSNDMAMREAAALSWWLREQALAGTAGTSAPPKGEALAFLDQTLDSGFRPGMGGVVPDRFFWAMPPAEDGDAPPDGSPEGTALPDTDTPDTKGKPAPRRVH